MFGVTKCLKSIVWAFVLLSFPYVAFAHGSLHDRIESLNERIAATPDDKQLYAERAELEAEHGHMRAARADLARARRIDPTWSEVDLVLARCLLRNGKLKEAQAAITAFREREPSSVEGLRVEAKIAFDLKKWAAAESLYTRYVSQAERVEPDDYLRAAEAITEQGKAHISRALSLLDAGVVRLGEAPVLCERAIKLAMRADDYDGALRRVNDAVAAAHHAERWLALKGDILVKLGKTEQAREAYRASLEAIAKRSEARKQSPAIVQLRQEVEASLARLPSK